MINIAKKNKYRAKICIVDGIKFRSIKEADYYNSLKILQKVGKITYFLRQVPFDLPGNVKYFIDFMVVYPDKTICYIDVKGFETPMFKLKKKQVEALYPIKIEIVK
jgi:hypothetical protein